MSGNPNWDTPPTTYGPSGPPQYSSSYDPNADHSSDITADTTIITIYPMVMDERPDDIDQAATGWRALADQLQTTRAELHNNYNALGTDWDSDSGDMFTGFVVSTTGTLDNWHTAATNNAAALSTLAGQIRKYQGLMRTMWDDGHGHGFVPELKAADDQYKKGNALWDSPSNWLDAWKYSFNGKGYHTELDPVLDHYTQRVKSEIVEPLNQAFSDAFAAIAPGMKWGGPTNGPTMDEITNALKKLNTPSFGPAGGVPAMPGATPPPPAAPPMPVMPPPVPTAAKPPAAPTPPAPPARPNAPIAPNAPAAPTAPRAPQALTKPTLPTMPTVPNSPTAPTAPTAPQGLGAVPPMPTVLRSPGGIPSAPTAPELPSASGLGRGTPPAGLGEPESIGEPGRPTAPGMPKSLQGRGGMPGEPEMPPGMRNGMRTPPPQLGGRGKPDRKPTRPGGPNNEEPEPPPGSRGDPALAGRNNKQNQRPGSSSRPGGGAGGDDIPPNRLGSPRSLQGIRDTKPRYRPGSFEAEELPLRRLPTMNGRLGPQTAVEESLESAEQALRPGLGGRGLSRPDQRQRPEPREETRPTMPSVDFVGDSELFTAAKPAPPVIDRPTEAEPVAAENAALRPKASGRA